MVAFHHHILHGPLTTSAYAHSHSHSLNKYARSDSLSPQCPRKLIHHTEVSVWELLPDSPSHVLARVWGLSLGLVLLFFVLLYLISLWDVVPASFCAIISHKSVAHLRFPRRDILAGQGRVKLLDSGPRCSGPCNP